MTTTKRRIGGHNQVLVSGHVDSRLVRGVTGDGGEACSFSVESGDGGPKMTYVRINAYGAVAEQCGRESRPGLYCVIIGELMNRPGKHGRLTEIRAKMVEFETGLNCDNQGDSDVER